MSFTKINRDLMVNISSDRKHSYKSKKNNNFFSTEKYNYKINSNKKPSFKINTFNSNRKIFKQKSAVSSHNSNKFEKYNNNLPVLMNNIAKFFNKKNNEQSNKIHKNNLKEIKNSFYEQDSQKKENLLNEITIKENNIQSKNKEISNLQTLCENLEKENTINRFFINKILEGNIDTDNFLTNISQQMHGQKHNSVDNSNDNHININNDFDIKEITKPKTQQDNKSLYETEYDKKINLYKRMYKTTIGFYSSKNENTKKKLKNLSKKEKLEINVIKKQIILYDKELEKQTEKLGKIKENENTTKYIQLKAELDKKTKELNEVYMKCKSIKKLINEKETVLEFYRLKSEKLTSIIGDAKKKLNTRLKLVYNTTEKKKKDLELKIEKLSKKKDSYDKELEEIDKQNKDLEKRNQELENELLKYNYILQERRNNTELINKTYSKEERLKKHILINSKKIEELESSNDNVNKLIDDYEKNQRNILIKKSKIPEKNKEKMKQLTSEIQKIKNEIKQIQKQKKDKDKEMQEKIDKNEEIFDKQNTEIQNFLEQKENLTNEINELNNQFELKKRNYTDKEEELKNLNKQIIDLKNEKNVEELNEAKGIDERNDNLNSIDDNKDIVIIEEKIRLMAEINEINNQNIKISEDNSKNKKILEEKKNELKEYKAKK